MAKSKEYRKVKKAVEDYASKAYDDGYNDGIREIDLILKMSATPESAIRSLQELVDSVL